jgi:murein L,D-transpeptidase YcbB/YkuD
LLDTRLRRSGDLPPDATPPEDFRYDGEIVAAVRRFQARHGLPTDGVLGAATLRELNVPLATRVRQIELSMERLRWLPHFRPGPIVAINVPSYTLWAFEAPLGAGDRVLSMRVVVGRAAMQTPIFIADMRHVEFSPYWNVPRAIQNKELLPRLLRDPGYLEREDMEIVRVRGEAPAASIDAATLDRLERGELRIRQRPGPKNALGGIKFALPNAMDIYLHATPAQELFERTRRDFSHGCIRIADPLALARFVLRDRPEWTTERMQTAIAAQKTLVVPLRDPVPVVIFYTTAIVDADDRAVFVPDVYRYDDRLERALAARASQR